AMELDKLTGTEIAGFSVGPLVGRSRSGLTYRARREGVEFALKILPPRLPESRHEASERFRRELETARGLPGEHLVRILDVGSDQGLHYLVMECVAGKTLAAVLQERKRLPVPEAASVIRQILAAAHVAHRAGLVHGDLKTSDIFLSADGVVKIAGFGLSKKLLNDAGLAFPAPADETVDYFSPERVDAVEMDGRADLYSIGIVAFELLTGERPFVYKSILALRIMHSKVLPPNPRLKNPAIPEPLSAFVLKLLAKKPDQRYPSARDAARALQGAVGAPPADVDWDDKGALAGAPPAPAPEAPAPAPTVGAPAAALAEAPSDAPPPAPAAAPEPSPAPAPEPAPATAPAPETAQGILDKLFGGTDAPAVPKEPKRTDTRSILAGALFGDEDGDSWLTSSPEPSPAAPEVAAPTGSPETPPSVSETALEKQLEDDLGREAPPDRPMGPPDAEAGPPPRSRHTEMIERELQKELTREAGIEAPASSPAALPDLREEIEETLRAASARLRDSEWTAAASLLEKVRALGAEDPRLDEMLAQAREAQATFEAKAAEFERLRADGDMIETEKLALQILELKPNDMRAREFLESLEALRKERQRKHEAERLVVRANRQIQSRDFTEAAESLRQAQALDSSRPDVAPMIAKAEQSLARAGELRKAAEDARGAGDVSAAAAALRELRDLVKDPAEVDAQLRDLGASETDRTLEEAERALDRREIAKAEEIAREALAKDPKNSRTRRLVKEVETVRGQVQEARSQADEHYAGKRWKPALDLYEEVVRLDPSDGEAAERAEEIRAIFEKHAARAPWKLPAAVAAGVAVLAAVVIGGIHVQKKSALDRAEALIGEKKFDEAMGVLDGVGGFLADAGRRDGLKARVARERGRPLPAPDPGPSKKGPGGTAKTPEPVAKKPPVEPPPESLPQGTAEECLRAAKSLLERGEWEGALASAEKARSLGAAAAEVELLASGARRGAALARGRAAEASGDWAAALAAFRDAASLGAPEAPGAVDALFRGRLEDAEASREKDPRRWADESAAAGRAFERMPEVVALLEKEGARLHEGGAYERAADVFEAAASATGDPRFRESGRASRAALLLKTGETLLERGEPGQALEAFEKAKAFTDDPRVAEWVRKASAALWKGQAEAFEKQGKAAEALALYRKVQEIDKTDELVAARAAALSSRIRYETSIRRMEALYAEGKYTESLRSAREAVSTGLDDGFAGRSVRS
ncbi:MAG: protein kinase, partial [Planctomycetes bacterium]|nr:protein kinase [Planctomycetota bacterium]